MLRDLLKKFKSHFRPMHLQTTMKYTGPTFAAAISPDGSIIASGGSDGVRLRRIGRNKDTSILLSDESGYECPQVSAVCWYSSLNDEIKTLVYGNTMGRLTIVQRRVRQGHFRVIRSILVDDSNAEIVQIVAGNYNEQAFIAARTNKNTIQVCVFSDDKNFNLVKLWSDSHWTQVHQRHIALDYDDLVIFTANGSIGRWSVEGDVEGPHFWRRYGIKYAAIDSDKRRFAVYNSTRGVDLYHLGNQERISNLPSQCFEEILVKNITLVKQSRAIVSGSDNGMIYIFDSKTGDLLHQINIGPGLEVETFATHDLEDGTVLIAVVSSTGTDGKSCVKVWRWKPTKGDPMDEDEISNDEDSEKTLVNGDWF